MQTQTYRRKPFKVEATQITEDNIEEIAEKIGRVMTREEDGARFIQIDPVVIPGMGRAYIGFYITKMNDRYRCYTRKTFNMQFELDETPEPNLFSE